MYQRGENIMAKKVTRVSVKKLSTGKVELTINVTAEEFDLALDHAFQKVVKEVKVPGFRPGKMPQSMFVKRFGWESLYQDAVEFALQGTYPIAVRESGVFPVADPAIDLKFEDLQKGKGFTYTAVVEVWEEAVLGEYKGIEVKRDSTKVTDAKVKAYIKKQLVAKQETVIKETAAKKGDTVVIDFEGFVDGVAFEGGKGENYPLELGSNSFIPGFEDQLIGAKPETEVDVNVTFPENYHEHLAGKAALFKVKVHEVKAKVTPKLTDELVQEMEIANVSNVEEYKAYVLDLLTKEAEAKADNKLMADLFKKINKNSKIIVPEAVLEQEVEKQVKRVEEQAKQYGVPAEVLLQYSGYASLDAFKEEGRKQLKVRIANDVIIEEIVKTEKIKATAKEIEAEYKKAAGDDAEKVEQLKTQFSSEQVAENIKYNKAIELIKKNAVIIQK